MYSDIYGTYNRELQWTMQLRPKAHDGMHPVVLADPSQYWRTPVRRDTGCYSEGNLAIGVQSGVDRLGVSLLPLNHPLYPSGPSSFIHIHLSERTSWSSQSVQTTLHISWFQLVSPSQKFICVCMWMDVGWWCLLCVTILFFCPEHVER